MNTKISISVSDNGEYVNVESFNCSREGDRVKLKMIVSEAIWLLCGRIIPWYRVNLPGEDE